MPTTMTIRELLGKETARLQRAGISCPRLEAEILAAHSLGITRIALKAHDDRGLTSAEQKKVKELVDERAQGIPLAYVTGNKEFYGRPFKVNPETLIPRPETEMLVEEALMSAGKQAKFADIGTGSGCIGLTLMLERPDLSGVLLDISLKALLTAQENARTLGVEEAMFCQGSLFDMPLSRGSLDFIVSNPPYIGTCEKESVQADVDMYEPGLALYSGDDGLKHIRALARNGKMFLRDGGQIVIEHGWLQGKAVQDILKEEGFFEPRTKKDLAGLDRMTFAVYKHFRC